MKVDSSVEFFGNAERQTVAYYLTSGEEGRPLVFQGPLEYSEVEVAEQRQVLHCGAQSDCDVVSVGPKIWIRLQTRPARQLVTGAAPRESWCRQLMR
jgi:hypothetical protein